MLFTKADVLLKIRIIINAESSIQILEKPNDIEEKELILMALLIYARILRIESSEDERNSMITTFSEFYKIYQKEDKSINYDKVIEYYNSKTYSISYFALKIVSKIDIKLKKHNNRYFLHMGSILVNPFSSIVFTTFMYVWNNVNEENKINLFNSFIILSKQYKQERFTTLTAVSIPNYIINEIIEFK